MNCPRCENETLVVLAEDSINCDCGRVQSMQYWYCGDCSYSFRTNNGKYMDGWDLSQVIVESSCRDLTGALQKVSSNEDRPLTDYIHPCVRCAAVSTHESKPGIYSCSECGFEWEILKND